MIDDKVHLGIVNQKDEIEYQREKSKGTKKNVAWM